MIGENHGLLFITLNICERGEEGRENRIEN
jgi:hypothetical protein